MPVTSALRHFVLERAKNRCEYCQIAGWPLTVDHIMPLSAWNAIEPGRPIPPFDPDNAANLAAACSPCNRAKSDAITGYDVLSGTEAALFNPRQQQWSEHFDWRDAYRTVIGCTPVGRVTARQLDFNRETYQQQRVLLRAAMRGGAPRWP